MEPGEKVEKAQRSIQQQYHRLDRTYRQLSFKFDSDFPVADVLTRDCNFHIVDLVNPMFCEPKLGVFILMATHPLDAIQLTRFHFVLNKAEGAEVQFLVVNVNMVTVTVPRIPGAKIDE